VHLEVDLLLQRLWELVRDLAHVKSTVHREGEVVVRGQLQLELRREAVEAAELVDAVGADLVAGPRRVALADGGRDV